MSLTIFISVAMIVVSTNDAGFLKLYFSDCGFT